MQRINTSRNVLKSIYGRRAVVKGVAYVLLCVIAFVDYVTGYEISSSILYLLPIYMISAHTGSSRRDSLIIAGISSLSWFVVEYFTSHPYAYALTFYWNGLVRMFTFFVLALAIYKIKSKNRQLEHANKRLEEVSQEKNKYIGIAAHDIRSPLNNIYSLSQLLLFSKNSSGLHQQQLDYITLISKISAGALSLLNNILDITQIEAGTLSVKKEEQEYISFLQEVVQMNSPIAESKGQHIELVAQQDEIFLSYDKTYMSQVLVNLLTNAIKFSYKDSVIRIEVEDEEQHVITRVVDTGVGIKEEDKEKVFRAFEKAQNLPTAGERSSGLGLAIVKKVVEAHGGTIGVKSTYGKGTTFYFTMPKELSAVPVS